MNAVQLPWMNGYPDFNLILVMDNAKIHSSRKIRRLCWEAGVRLVYLPPYCPELNPIELCFSQLKYYLRRTQMLMYHHNPTWAIRRATHWVVMAELCRSLYAHCNYNCPPDGSS